MSSRRKWWWLLACAALMVCLTGGKGCGDSDDDGGCLQADVEAQAVEFQADLNDWKIFRSETDVQAEFEPQGDAPEAAPLKYCGRCGCAETFCPDGCQCGSCYDDCLCPN